MTLPPNGLLLTLLLLVCLVCAPANATVGKGLSGLTPDAQRGHATFQFTLYLAQFKPRKRKQKLKHKQKNPGRSLIPPSVAAKRAQSVVGGKILGVRLRGRMYIVKLRGQGQVFTVRVDALTGRVLGP